MRPDPLKHYIAHMKYSLDQIERRSRREAAHTLLKLAKQQGGSVGGGYIVQNAAAHLLDRPHREHWTEQCWPDIEQTAAKCRKTLGGTFTRR